VRVSVPDLSSVGLIALSIDFSLGFRVVPNHSSQQPIQDSKKPFKIATSQSILCV
jgi:hypothetical protein